MKLYHFFKNDEQLVSEQKNILIQKLKLENFETNNNENVKFWASFLL